MKARKRTLITLDEAEQDFVESVTFAFGRFSSVICNAADIVTPILIGYFPKRTVKRPDWLKTAGVEEICSVSDCISKGPDGWVNHWRHNDMSVYDTPASAWSVVPENARQEFDLYAYCLFSTRFVEGKQEPFEIPPLNVEPLPRSFVRLGYDAVSRSCGSNFECSPLSCNYLAGRVIVSRYCLVDTESEAVELAREFSLGGCEAGPYHVVEVWRNSNEAG
ncbi:MAG: hypothetical protein ABI651_11875 [Verrucomicrobiota bacterium]